MRQTTRYIPAPFSEQAELFVTIDFDGTINASDVTDAVIKKFARFGWQEVESLWEEGRIGSRECLARQMALVDAPLEQIVEYACTHPIDPGFPDFMRLLKGAGIPFAIISDGFKPIINGIFAAAGFSELPVHANDLLEDATGLKTIFPNTSGVCQSGTCKCKTADLLAGGLPIVHIGDGRSDFCISRKATHVFSRGKLTGYCVENDIPHSAFTDFQGMQKDFEALLNGGALMSLEQNAGMGLSRSFGNHPQGIAALHDL
jgi:2,3-diketo-5-methylthio-1-phosphopentane phosphatase